jgi:hypothetical protein
MTEIKKFQASRLWRGSPLAAMIIQIPSTKHQITNKSQ